MGKLLPCLILLLLIVGSAEISMAVPIAGMDFFTTDLDGNRRNVFSNGETVVLRAESLTTVTCTVDVYLVFPPGSGRENLFLGSFPLTVRAPLMVTWYQLPQDSPPGRYSFKVVVYNQPKTILLQEGYVDFNVQSSAPQSPPQPQTPYWSYYGLVAGILIVTGIAVIILKRKPKPAIQEPLRFSHGSQVPESGQTILKEAGTTQLATSGGETRILTAMFEFGDKIIPISSLPQAFGREDFINIIPRDALNSISRRSKPQFVINYDYANRTFTIEDYNSTNGTLLNGENIKGKGPFPLKDGDIVSPAGVVNLKFVTK
ncbi:MAG: FHA domain-containing protein [Archaeoglobaceae archaeon]